MKGTYLVHVDMVGPGHEGTFSLEAIVDAIAEIIYECLEGQELDTLGGNDYCDLWNRMLAMSVGKRVTSWQRWIRLSCIRALQYSAMDPKLSWIVRVDIITRETRK